MNARHGWSLRKAMAGAAIVGIVWMGSPWMVRGQPNDPAIEQMKLKRQAEMQAEQGVTAPVPSNTGHALPRVFFGADPDKIPISDEVITQIVPVEHVDAIRLRNDLLPMLTTGTVTSNATSNCIIFTDTAANVHHFVTVIAKLDAQAGAFNGGKPGVPGRVLPAHAPGELLYAGSVLGPMAEIMAPSDGVVAKVAVTDGEQVKAGQLLISMDGAAWRAELDLAMAHLQAAKARLAQLTANGATAEQQNEARAETAGGEAQVALCQQRIAEAQLKSPFDAVLTEVDIKPGQWVKAGTVLTRVVGTGNLKVEFLVAAEGARVGQKVISRGAGQQAFPGMINYVSPIVDKATNTVTVRATIEGGKDGVKAGMFVSVSLIAETNP